MRSEKIRHEFSRVGLLLDVYLFCGTSVSLYFRREVKREVIVNLQFIEVQPHSLATNGLISLEGTSLLWIPRSLVHTNCSKYT